MTTIDTNPRSDTMTDRNTVTDNYIGDQRSRLARISRSVDVAALTQAMRDALHTDDDSQLMFADLADDDVVALLERFDRPGFVVSRVPANRWQPERAEVGVILPSGDTVTINVYGPDKVSWPSIGEVSSADAAAFAAAMGVAAGVASTLRNQTDDVD